MTARDAEARAKAQGLSGKLVANRYLVGQVLGAGGLCVVYRAEDLRRQRDVAFKVLPREKALVDELARRFEREVATVQRIDHPHIAAITDSGRLDDGGRFLVMELLDGQLLSMVLEKGRFPWRRALGVARQVLVGLGEAHRLGIIHRDVKPQNVMLLKMPGGVELVKLFDFGIAANERAAVKLTAAGTAFGTPEYISPEMAMGQKVDPRADFYSLGVMMFEMLTGKLPFEKEDGIELLRAHIHEDPPPVRKVAPDAEIPAGAEAVVLRAMAKKPEQRYASSQSMIAAIDRVLGYRPVDVGAGARGKSAALAAAAVVLLAVLGALGWWFLRAH